MNSTFATLRLVLVHLEEGTKAEKTRVKEYAKVSEF